MYNMADAKAEAPRRTARLEAAILSVIEACSTKEKEAQYAGRKFSAKELTEQAAIAAFSNVIPHLLQCIAPRGSGSDYRQQKGQLDEQQE